MEWFYADQGRQIGPVSQTEFDRLVSGGTIGAETLVWRQGMPQWQTYAEAAKAPSGAAGPAAPASSAIPSTGAAPQAAVCSECGRALPADEVVAIAGRTVCAACKPAYLQRVREGSVPAAHTFGGFWIRFGARVIDGIILWIVNTAMTVPIIGSLDLTPGGAEPPQVSMAMIKAQLILGFLQLAVSAAYETLFVGRFAATPGKMACRLRVVRPDGGRVSYARALGRYGGTIISGVTLCIGYVIAAFDEEKRTLHDRICDTRVIRK